MKKQLFKFLNLILIFVLLFNSNFLVVVLAQVPENSPSPTPENTAQAVNTDTTTIVDNNDVTLNNDIETNANTGNNEILPSPDASPVEEVVQVEASPSLEASPEPDVSPEPVSLTDELTSEPSASLSPTPDPSANPESTGSANLLENDTTGSVSAQNNNTPDNSNNTAASTDTNTTTVNNDNDSNVDNKLNANSTTGNNDLDLVDSLETGSASSSADVSNVINTNITGEDFLYALVNLISASESDLDLSQITNSNLFSPEIVSIISQNQATGQGSVNIALANLISAISIYNQNQASLQNNICVTGDSGNNTLTGDNTNLTTGSASAILNLFNMVNTNLTGNDWYFSVINLFKSLNADLILPYELDILGAQNNNSSSASAINQNTGTGSANLATALSSNILNVNNDNDANIDNNLTVSADSGNNTVNGSGNINTGDANASANLANLINTNITGSNWLMVVVQNLGNWQGSVVGWWGNFLQIGNLTFLWMQMPTNNVLGTNTTAVNSNTGEGSTNISQATSMSSIDVNNDNDATITNNLTVSANSGHNNLTGENGNITTGDAIAQANVVNVANTNIFGNHWYFSLITIYENFIGDLIFPRPDLLVQKSADRSNVKQGENLTYTISYVNQGRISAKNSVITDSLPEGMTFVSASNNASINGNQILWNVGEVLAKQAGQVTITVNIVKSSGNLVNNVSITTVTDEPKKDNNVGGSTINIDFPQSSSSPNSNNDSSNSSDITASPSLIGQGFYPGFAGDIVEATPEPSVKPVEVLGTSDTNNKPVCNWSIILSILSLILTSAVFALWGHEKPSKWWLFPILMAFSAYFGDQFIAHKYFEASKYCNFMWLFSSISVFVPSFVYKIWV